MIVDVQTRDVANERVGANIDEGSNPGEMREEGGGEGEEGVPAECHPVQGHEEEEAVVEPEDGAFDR